jgi:hypothetical protein
MAKMVEAATNAQIKEIFERNERTVRSDRRKKTVGKAELWVTELDALLERIRTAEADKARLSEALRPFADMADYLDSETEGFADTDEFDLLYEDHLFHHFKVADFRDARAALSESVSRWREITEDDRPPNDVEVLMGCWESWPRNQWVVEYGLYGSTKGGWIHGRMTHWLPSNYLPAAPQQGGE